MGDWLGSWQSWGHVGVAGELHGTAWVVDGCGQVSLAAHAEWRGGGGLGGCMPVAVLLRDGHATLRAVLSSRQYLTRR